MSASKRGKLVDFFKQVFVLHKETHFSSESNGGQFYFNYRLLVKVNYEEVKDFPMTTI